jgi:hypothetical protein
VGLTTIKKMLNQYSQCDGRDLNWLPLKINSQLYGSSHLARSGVMGFTSLGVKRQGVKLFINLYVISRIRLSGAISPVPPHVFKARQLITGETLPLRLMRRKQMKSKTCDSGMKPICKTDLAAWASPRLKTWE